MFNDPDGVYRSVLLDLDKQIFGMGNKIQAAGKFPDDLDVLPPFPDDHIEAQPPSPFFPQPTPKDPLNKFNNPISFQPNEASVPDGPPGRFPGWVTQGSAPVSPPLQPDQTSAPNEKPTRSLGRFTYDPSQDSPFTAKPAPSPAAPDGSLSINDAYLEYLKRLNAN